MKRWLAMLGLLATGAAGAQTPTADLFLAELSRCDGQFFEKIGEQRQTLDKLAPLRTKGRAAVFKVPDPAHSTNSRVMFSKPVEVAGLKVVGYFDEILEAPGAMSFYSWGYLIADSVKGTASRLRGVIWESDRLRADGPVFVRSELWTNDKPEAGWSRAANGSGVPKAGTIERVLLIEPYDGETAFIRFGCSIQGSVTDPVLRSVRPDLRD